MLNKLFFACVLGFVCVLPAQASSVLPLSLEQIIDRAALAFQGSCTANRSERDSQTGRIVTYTTFQVQDVLKGQVESSYTIKQIGGRLPDEDGAGVAWRLDGVPRFQVGASYVVFLYGVSAAGFSSPVGLTQGRFHVLQGPAGLQVSNGRDFKEMAPHPAALLSPSLQDKIGRAAGPLDRLDLGEFKQLVRQRAAALK